jgi:hypothetical protein
MRPCDEIGRMLDNPAALVRIPDVQWQNRMRYVGAGSALLAQGVPASGQRSASMLRCHGEQGGRNIAAAQTDVSLAAATNAATMAAAVARPLHKRPFTPFATG